MRYKLEKLGCYILIIVLLPYIITIFLNGPMVESATSVEETTVRVKANNSKETDKGKYLEMAIEDYGIGVLAREIPAVYESEALKTQAIIVRTRIYRKLEENGRDTVLDEEFFTQSDMENAWGITKFAANYNKLESAWRQTEGQVLTYKDELIYTPFFSLSNGSTRDGKEALGKDYPYLKIKDCPLDIEETEQIQTVILEDMGTHSESFLKVLSCDTAGYVLKVQIGEEEINGEEFRQNYNLVSSCFTVQEYEGKIRITTRGVGHGIGLSQNTANKMAESGKSAEEILKYFYDGCELKMVADIVGTSE